MEFSCSVCNYTSDTRKNVRRHINKKNKCGTDDDDYNIIEKPIEINCEHCDKCYKTQPSLKRHLRNCKVLKINQEVVNSIGVNKPIFKFDEESLNFIYILKEREFIKSKEHIFKLGYTTKGILARSNGYPKGSKIYVTLPVVGNPELEIIKRFKELFIHRNDIGNEYFEGSFEKMFKELLT